jgi:hypothetical protein
MVKTSKVENFGPKIGGSRADQFRERQLGLEDLAEMGPVERAKHCVKDSVWHPIDYEKMIAGGTPKIVAFFLKSLKDSIPVAPDESHQAEYVEIVSRVRDQAMALKGREEIPGMLTRLMAPDVDTSPPSPGIYGSYRSYGSSRPRYTEKGNRLISTLGSKACDKLQMRDYDVSNLERRMNRNCWMMAEEPWEKAMRINKVQVFAPGSYRTIENGVWVTPSQFSVYHKDSRFHEKGIKTREEALAVAKKLVEDKGMLDRAKAVPILRPRIAFLRHEGLPEYAKGNVITEDIFQKHTGIRSGEFGHWTNQDHRRVSLSRAFNALSTLTDVLGVPSNAVGLNGTLSLAIGSRGHGVHSAHFEPKDFGVKAGEDVQRGLADTAGTRGGVINLTKTRGDGALCHEWAHGLDNYLGNLANVASGLRPYASEDVPSLGRSALPQAVAAAYSDVMRAIIDDRPETPEEAKKRRDATVAVERLNARSHADDLFKDYSAKVTDPEKLKAFREQLDGLTAGDGKHHAALVGNLSLKVYEDTGRPAPGRERTNFEASLRRMHSAETSYADVEAGRGSPRLVPSEYFKNAKALDDNRSKPYWAEKRELFARAFESYVSDKLTERGACNNYLVNGVTNEPYLAVNSKCRPYPEGEERATINRKMGALIQTVIDYQLLPAHGIAPVLTEVEGGGVIVPDLDDEEMGGRAAKRSARGGDVEEGPGAAEADEDEPGFSGGEAGIPDLPAPASSPEEPESEETPVTPVPRPEPEAPAAMTPTVKEEDRQYATRSAEVAVAQNGLRRKEEQMQLL